MKVEIDIIDTELDAFEIYTLFRTKINTIFLDGGMEQENYGRYSFVGINPFLTVKLIKEDEILINNKVYHGDIFLKLKDILREYKVENNTDLPFVAGGIGYFSYDLCRKLEKIPVCSKETVNIPEVYFNFYDNLIIIDNYKRKTFITALGVLDNKSESIKKIKNLIKQGTKVHYSEVSDRIKEKLFSSNFSKPEYIKAVENIREYIKNGHIYITNLTQRFSCKCNMEAYEVYKALRYINPAPFAAFMNLEGFAIASASPERFLKISNRKVETRPIKGTTPRGKNKNEDIFFKEKLLSSEKDRSELLMIVDLERNDLSKVCSKGTVKVKELFKLEEYPTVNHLVATINGTLKDEKDCIDCLKACFPGGSITGAPKIRSMEIIDELEKVRRNIYTGSIGYIGFDGNIDLNIVIRTIHIQEGMAYFGVGGGITYESDAESEYNETLVKAKALMRVLSNGVE